MEISIIMAHVGITIGCIIVAGAILSRGSEKETGIHTVEIYHGNHWSSWLTPRQNRLYTAATCTGGAVAFLGTIAIVIGMPLLFG